MPKPFTAVILTALPVEYNAVRLHLTELREIVHKNGTVYESGRFNGGGHPWEVSLAEIGAGNPAAAAEAERAIDYFDPSLVFFVGVAGGIKDVKLGDVVAATKIYGYEAGKAETEFHPRPTIGNSSHALEQRARAEARKQDWLRRLSARNANSSPRVLVGPIAAGEKVVASTRSTVYTFIRTNYGDSLAVEMEGRGFLEAAHINHPVQAIVIRGISDLIDKKGKADAGGSQEIAADHASAFAFELLAKFDGSGATDLPKELPVTSSEPTFPIFEVPYRANPNFTGRTEIIASLRQNLSAAAPAIIPQVIAGLGGVGKTQIAVEYAYRYSTEYDLVWWIRAEEAATLAADYLTLANQLELPVKTSAEQRVFANLVRRWLESTPRRWLLIYDNIENPADMRELLPGRGNGHILLTSRRRDWDTLAQVLPEITPFTPEEARTFLFKRINQSNQIAIDSLAELVGYLPLALEQAGAFMSKSGMPVEEYIRLYQEQRRELWKQEAPPTDYKKTVTTTWELTFQHIKDSSPPGIALLNLCSFFAPDHIPLSIFQENRSYLPAELSAVAANPFTFAEAVQPLHQYSLVKRQSDTLQGDSLSIHRLVQEVVRERLGAERGAAWLEIAVKLVSHLFTYDKFMIATWPVSTRILPHALAVVTHAEQYQVALAEAATIWQKTGEYLREQGEYPKAIGSIEHALRLRAQLFGEDHEIYAESLDYLGELEQKQANYAKAEICHQRALVIRQQKWGQDHPDIAASLNNLGSLFQDQGKYAQAQAYYEAALAIRRQVLGEQHPDTATSLNNLGLLFQDQGKYAQVPAYYEAALAIRRQVLGEQHPDTAASLHNLGVLFQAQGKYAQAQAYYEAALSIHRQVLGEQHPDTATTLNNLGVLFQDQGKYAQAQAYYEAALAIRRQVVGEQHPDTATSLSSLGLLFQDQGKYAQAQAYYEAALSIHRQVLGEQHPHTATSLNNLGTLFQAQVKYAQAQEYHKTALAIRRQVLGEQHPDTASSLHNLGTLFQAQGKYVAARPYLEQALTIYEKLQGDKNPNLVTILSSLAQVMFALKQFEAARRYITRALTFCQERNEQYTECEKVKLLLIKLPGPIGHPKKRK